MDETRLQKQALASALGMNPSSLSLSHLQDATKSKYIYQRLSYVLRRDNLLAIARYLRLSLDGVRALKRLASAVLTSSTGYRIDPESMLERSWEAAEYGMVGCEYFDTGSLEQALPYLQHAWQYFRPLPLETRAEFEVMLRAGAQILELYANAGQAAEAKHHVRQLVQIARDCRDTDREMGRAVAFAYKAGGTALRHAGGHPEYSIQMAVEAGRILKEHGFADERIGPLRNQAKPYVAWGWRDPSRRASCFEAALAKVEHSEALAGGSVPREEVLDEWLLTRFTRVECLAGLERRDETLRLWDETMELDTVRAIASSLDRRPDLYAKWAFAQMAVCFSIREFDRMAALAEAFARAPENEKYGERLQRCESIIRCVTRGDSEGVRQVLIK